MTFSCVLALGVAVSIVTAVRSSTSLGALVRHEVSMLHAADPSLTVAQCSQKCDAMFDLIFTRDEAESDHLCLTTCRSALYTTVAHNNHHHHHTTAHHGHHHTTTHHHHTTTTAIPTVVAAITDVTPDQETIYVTPAPDSTVPDSTVPESTIPDSTIVTSGAPESTIVTSGVPESTFVTFDLVETTDFTTVPDTTSVPETTTSAF